MTQTFLYSLSWAKKCWYNSKITCHYMFSCVWKTHIPLEFMFFTKRFSNRRVHPTNIESIDIMLSDSLHMLDSKDQKNVSTKWDLGLWSISSHQIASQPERKSETMKLNCMLNNSIRQGIVSCSHIDDIFQYPQSKLQKSNYIIDSLSWRPSIIVDKTLSIWLAPVSLVLNRIHWLPWQLMNKAGMKLI